MQEYYSTINRLTTKAAASPKHVAQVQELITQYSMPKKDSYGDIVQHAGGVVRPNEKSPDLNGD